MAIKDGEIVKVRFTQALVGNVTGLEPPIRIVERKVERDDVRAVTAGSTNSTYPVKNAFDGSTSTRWRGSGSPNWLKVEFYDQMILTRLRFYLSTSYYVKSFTLFGSGDDENWTQIGELYEFTVSTEGWYEASVSNEIQYKFYRIDVVGVSSTIDLFELELYETKALGNESCFEVSFEEYEYVPEGKLIRSVRDVKSVEKHTSISEHLSLSDGVGFHTSLRDGKLQLALKKEAGETNGRL